MDSNAVLQDFALQDIAPQGAGAKDISDTKKRALRILGKRSFSEREMIKRLTGKGEDTEDAENTVRWLAEMGYIDDRNYAAQIVNHYAAKGYGQARIRDELSQRGIPRDMWDEQLSVLDETVQIDTAIEYLQKKYRSSELADRDNIRRATQALVRRGFSYDEAHSAVKRFLELCAEELE